MNKIKKILIANRSEIACRIIRACKELGIKTVVVYSEADINALHKKLADESVFIGNSPAKESYLDFNKIIEAAKSSEADAIHPGYGFLSENYEFNKAVRNAGLIYIGPEPESMRILGSKIDARNTMIEAGVPVVPGFSSSSATLEEYKTKANEIGFPIIVKASAGGGGKGMRIVRSIEELQDAITTASREAKSAFGNDSIFIEHYVESPRHIEVQVAGDKFKNYIHLFERECSLQRRHQKIIEETPSTALNPELRLSICNAALEAVKAVGYENVATVEFLLDGKGKFYFLEVNTRVQVEHPITEMVTGIDLVKLQIKIAEGEKIHYKQSEINQRGHSIECRIYAEDSDNNFMPSAGKILFYKEANGNGIRIDTGINQDSEIPVFYDPIMAKVITYGSDRKEATDRMIYALNETVILGVRNSIPFMMDLLESDEFQSGNTFTNTVDKLLQSKVKGEENIDLIFATSGLVDLSTNKTIITNNNYFSNEIPSVWNSIGKWEIGGYN